MDMKFEKGKYYQLVEECWDGQLLVPLIDFICVGEDLLMQLPEREENIIIDVSIAKQKFKFVEITEDEFIHIKTSTSTR